LIASGKWYDDDDILKVLPPNLRGEIVSFNQRKIIHQVPLFSPERSPTAFVGRLAPYLSTRLMFSGEIVFEEDTTGEEIFFIKSGIVQILSKFCDPAVKAIADGCYFGDVACLLGCKRTASTRARTNCSVDVLLKEHLLKLLVDYPQVLQYMVDVAKKRKLRLDCLDSAKNVPALSDEQLVDEEDLGTRYFMKLEEKAALGTFDVGTNSQLEDLDHLAAKFRAFSEESDEEEELSGMRYAGNDDDDMEFSPLRDLDTKRSPPSPRYFVKQESGFLQAAGGDLGELKDLAAAAVGGKATSFPPNEESTSPPPSPRFYVKQSSGALKLEGGDDGEDKEVVAPKSTLKSSADDVPPKTSVAAKHSFVLDEVGDDDLEGSMHKTADFLAQESQGSSKPVRGGGRGGGERSSRRSVANHEVPPKPAKTRASPVKGSPRQSPPRKPDKGVQPRSRTVTEEYSLSRGALGDSSVALDDYASELAESTELTAVTATPSSGQYNKFKEVKNEGSTVL
jgi:CRP-like cAMP-binding protein